MSKRLHFGLSGHARPICDRHLNNAKPRPRCPEKEIKVSPWVVVAKICSSTGNREPVTLKERFGAAQCIRYAYAQNPREKQRKRSITQIIQAGHGPRFHPKSKSSSVGEVPLSGHECVIESWKVFRTNRHVGIENNQDVARGGVKTLKYSFAFAASAVLFEKLDITLWIPSHYFFDPVWRAVGRAPVHEYQF